MHLYWFCFGPNPEWMMIIIWSFEFKFYFLFCKILFEMKNPQSLDIMMIMMIMISACFGIDWWIEIGKNRSFIHRLSIVIIMINVRSKICLSIKINSDCSSSSSLLCWCYSIFVSYNNVVTLLILYHLLFVKSYYLLDFFLYKL